MTTKTEMQHVQCPWKFELHNGKHCIFPVKGGSMICQTAGIPFCEKDDRANVAYIVRACNNFENLLEACKQLIRKINHYISDYPEMYKDSTFEMIKNAVNLAEHGENERRT